MKLLKWTAFRMVFFSMIIFNLIAMSVFSSEAEAFDYIKWLPPVPVAIFEWSMPDRYGLDNDGDGLRDAFTTYESIHPDYWTVNFDASGSYVNSPLIYNKIITEYRWRIDGGEVFVTQNPQWSYHFDREATYEVELTVVDQSGTFSDPMVQNVIVQDWLIVAVGDSYSSGEGNPDVPSPLENILNGIGQGALIDYAGEAILQCGQSNFEDAWVEIQNLKFNIDTEKDALSHLKDAFDAAEDELKQIKEGLAPVFAAYDEFELQCYETFPPWGCPVAIIDLESALFNYGFDLENIEDVITAGLSAVNTLIEGAYSATENFIAVKEEEINNKVLTIKEATSELIDLQECVDNAESELQAKWLDKQCHRSKNSKEAMAALELERQDPHTSVTFVHLACSGATVTRGLLSNYLGPEPPVWLEEPFNQCVENKEADGLSNIPAREACCAEFDDRGEPVCKKPQLEEAAALTANREVDALLISIGGNDVGFGPIITGCMLTEKCNEDTAEARFPEGPGASREAMSQFICAELTPLEGPFDSLINKSCQNYIQGSFKLTEDIFQVDLEEAGTIENTAKDLFEQSFEDLANKYSDVNSTIENVLGIPADRVFISEYPNAVTNEVGEYCDCTSYSPLEMLPGISSSEATWAGDTMTHDLNTAISNTQGSFGWNVVDGIYDLYDRHGYCSNEQWFRRIHESFYRQLNETGAMHPSTEGNEHGAEIYFVKLRDKLYADDFLTPILMPTIPPISDPGGPYVINEGETITLDNNSHDWIVGQELESFTWDVWKSSAVTLSGQNVENPQVTGIQDGTAVVSLQVENSFGTKATATTTVTVKNVAPQVTLTPPEVAYRGVPAKVIIDINDPGIMDHQNVIIDWGDGSDKDEVTVFPGSHTVPHNYLVEGAYSIYVWVEDGDFYIKKDAKVAVVIHPHEIDDDKDGYSEIQGDCNDNDKSINPKATEVCDGLDNNCDGQVDEGMPVDCFRLHVNQASTGTPADGRSWETAYRTLQEALAVAVHGQYIWVAQGTYTPVEGLISPPADPRSAAFYLKSGVSIIGGFSGIEVDPDQRDSETYETILSGNINDPGSAIDNSYHVLIADTGIDETAIIDGFTIRDGYDSTTGRGGGMRNNSGSSATIRNCRFLNNYSGHAGGAMYNYGAPSINNCYFSGNQAEYGGAVQNSTSNSTVANPQFISCTFANNTSTVGGGGAVRNYLSGSSANRVIFKDCIFANNTASASGGGMASEGSWLDVSGSEFIGNRTTGSLSTGGGYASSSASNDVITNTLFEANSTKLDKGSYGGAYILRDGGTSTTENCTFVNNTSLLGGGLYVAGTTPTHLTVRNSIFWNNSTPGSSGHQMSVGSGGQLTISFSDIQLGINSPTAVGNLGTIDFGAFPDADAAGMISSDPLFRDKTIDMSVSHWHLNYGSPCIDSGDPSSDYSLEPDSPAGRINMGFYGNTAEATSGCALTWESSLEISDGAYVTDKSLVDISYEASSTMQCASSLGMEKRYSNDGLHWSIWRTYYDNQFSWDLSDSNYGGSSEPGSKTLYTQYRDLYGNLSGVYSDSIILRPDPIVYVNINGIGGDGSGASWENSVRSLQDALLFSRAGDEIWVAEGEYRPHQCGEEIECDRSVSFELKNNVALYGGFNGTETSIAERDYHMNVTVLTGDLYADDEVDFVNYDENSHHVVVGSRVDASAILDGFTIKNGHANYSGFAYPENGGAGMYNENGSPTVSNCIFENNLAPLRGGGGMLNHVDSSPDIHNCIFRNNVGTNGGGLYNAYGSSPLVTNTIFYQNQAGVDGQGGYGGGVELVYSSDAHFENCTLSVNTATAHGGGIRSFYSKPQVMNTILWGNVSPVGPQIDLSNSLIQITYSALEGGLINIGNANEDNTAYHSNIDVSPAFADALLHLGTSSPCIDTGNPFSEYSSEPDFPNGKINMGAYGNTSEATVAIDSDQDGIPDGLDGCPGSPFKIEPGICGCSEPDTDIDGDLVLDCLDICPIDAENDVDGDSLCSNEDNCPMIGNPDQDDTDIDGVGDVCDNCPLVANPDQLDANGDSLGNACDSASDADSDGLTDAEEFACGSDPLDGESVCSRGMPWLMLLLDDE